MDEAVAASRSCAWTLKTIHDGGPFAHWAIVTHTNDLPILLATLADAKLLNMRCGTLATGELDLLLHILRSGESGYDFLFVDAGNGFLEERAATTAMAWTLPISPAGRSGKLESSAGTGASSLSKLNDRCEAEGVEVVLPLLCVRS